MLSARFLNEDGGIVYLKDRDGTGFGDGVNPVRSSVIWILFATAAFAQLTARNPVDELKDQVTQVLDDAGVPLTPDQERQLALLIEEERQAAENLFGITWDFSQGPPQGEQRDQALAGIRWMYDELRAKLPAYMTADQRAAWEDYASVGSIDAYVEDSASPAAQTGRIQQIRVTNNAFNVETATASGNGGPAGGGARTEVIERGGVGAYHGNFVATFQDERLNARNPFATNKPPYNERTINGNVSGPVWRDRLSLNFSVDDTRRENVGTVKAETPDGPFSLGITRPALNRAYDVKGVLQIADAHSLIMGVQYATSDSQNENVGDFTLPERASRTQGHNHMIDLREISILSDRMVHDVRFAWHRDHSETIPASNALAINVKDAFSGGGAQNHSRLDGDTYELSNLIYFSGERLTMRSGVQALHRREDSLTEDNFFGEFTFSDLASFDAGSPLKYRVTCCEPAFEISQTELGLFSQNDLKLSDTFTLMLGLRYQLQSNVPDHNNVDPRIGFAYAIGNATVVRGGAGIFSQWVRLSDIQINRRLDGQQLYEIQIDNPGWPEPFASGSVRPRSRRVVDPDMRAPYYIVSQIGVERSLPRNLFVTVAYDYSRGVKPVRYRDLNAPLPGTGVRPFPEEGQVVQVQTSGFSAHHHLRATMRQRFSIFNVTANYLYHHGLSDQVVDARRRGDADLPTNSYDLSQEWGNAGNPRHRFSAGVNSRLPLDVYLNTVIDATSGPFYTITTGLDDNQDGVINDRPPGVPKNSEVGPSFFDVSFNFSKSFELDGQAASSAGSAAQVNVFANLNNAFNKTHLGKPSGVMTSPFFGQSFNATSPRSIEVGMRFQF